MEIMISMRHYPENISIGPEDFRACGWQSALDNETHDGYSSMWQSLSSAAKQAIADGKASQGKILWLLSDACSMMLRPESINNPFWPIWEMGDRRSALPEDFEKSDITLFSQIVEEIDNFRLKARLADLVWLLQCPRDPKFALLAIDAYSTVPLDKETWLHDARECWERALRLARMLRAGAGDRPSRMEKRL